MSSVKLLEVKIISVFMKYIFLTFLFQNGFSILDVDHEFKKDCKNSSNLLNLIHVIGIQKTDSPNYFTQKVFPFFQ